MKLFVEGHIHTLKRLCKFENKILNSYGNILGGFYRCKILAWLQIGVPTVGQKVITPKCTQITKMMSDLNSWLFPLFKDTLSQIAPLVQKIYGFEVGRSPSFFSKFSKN